MKIPTLPLKTATTKKILFVFIAATGFVFVFGLFVLLFTKYIINHENFVLLHPNKDTQGLGADYFPIGVDPAKKEIVENASVDWYVESYLSIHVDESRKQRLFDRMVAELAKWDFYQQFASPRSRVLVIYPGERKEEIAKNFGDILKWTKSEREQFMAAVVEAEPLISDGKFYPGRYVVDIDTSPEVVAETLNSRFDHEIADKYNPEIATKVPLKDALTIASLLEREAYDFTDMRYISGIIWNRTFINMPLQLDATLQYVRGSKPSEPKWWPAVRPNDKFLSSPYNTYKNTGLPPAPIANPSVEAVVAALNPRATDCLFYFHDKNGEFYCSATYEDHIASLKKVYGRGQ
ncbi:MAG: endolytic transglycosylase MltG [Candidatus Nomurabacteria bacterium]|nr:endolytic transglycosylase MltG [Candidatus Nomurabacteria bacterium]USN87959.1 MAG: endolytic transglycosylase MltG [Candidatus Nomurabacteria bacterium]